MRSQFHVPWNSGLLQQQQGRPMTACYVSNSSRDYPWHHAMSPKGSGTTHGTMLCLQQQQGRPMAACYASNSSTDDPWRHAVSNSRKDYLWHHAMSPTAAWTTHCTMLCLQQQHGRHMAPCYVSNSSSDDPWHHAMSPTAAGTTHGSMLCLQQQHG